MTRKTWKAWTMKELSLLEAMVKEGKRDKEIAEALERTVKSIVQQKMKSELTVSKEWTKREEMMLQEVVSQGMTVRHMALRIGRSNSAVREKKSRMGLRLSKRNLYKINQDKRISFSKEEYKAMREDYEDRGRNRMTCEQIAKKYNLSDQVLKKIAREKGWTRKRASAKTKPPIDFSLLFKAYYEDCMSIYAMKKLFRCSDRRIYQSLEEHGLALLPQEERLKIRDEFGDRESVRKKNKKTKGETA